MEVKSKYIKIIFKYAAVTSAIIIIYELCFQLLLYGFIKFDYFIAMAVVIALEGITAYQIFTQAPDRYPQSGLLLRTKIRPGDFPVRNWQGQLAIDKMVTLFHLILHHDY